MTRREKSNGKTIFKSTSPRNISLTVEAGLIPAFSQLLQNGFWIKGYVGCSVKSFLCEQFGLSPEYLEKRIQTMFLDGDVVDDVERATVGDGATVSLSAAMPGLAGAVLRKGGYYAAMRDQISFKGKMMSASLQPGKVLVKLFNMPLQELGPIFLEHGIWVESDKFKGVLKARSDDFLRGCGEVLADGRQFGIEQLLEMDWGRGDIFLRIKTI
ncbi:MAG: hypothetical protein ACLP9S_17745 [Syntrophales bacterium]|jgi:hypothetical protein